MKGLLQAATVALIALGAGAATVATMKDDVPDLAVPERAWTPGSELDGKVFRVTGTIVGSGAELPETELSFIDGKFQSSRCQIYCEFGWNEYQTWTDGDVVHFTAKTICPDAPHTVVWHGSIEGDAMQVEGTWTTRRWYWTRQMVIDGQGRPATPGAKIADG